MINRTRAIGVAFASVLLMLMVAGCGATTASHSTQSHTSSSASTKLAHRGHKRNKLRRVRGTVTSVTATALTIHTKKGKVFTAVLTSKTKYRMKKVTSSWSTVKVGGSVVIVTRGSQAASPTAVIVRIH